MISHQPRDVGNEPILGAISQIMEVQTFFASSLEWTPIVTYYDTKDIILQPRDQISWRFYNTLWDKMIIFQIVL